MTKTLIELLNERTEVESSRVETIKFDETSVVGHILKDNVSKMNDKNLAPIERINALGQVKSFIDSGIMTDVIFHDIQLFRLWQSEVYEEIIVRFKSLSDTLDMAKDDESKDLQYVIDAVCHEYKNSQYGELLAREKLLLGLVAYLGGDKLNNSLNKYQDFVLYRMQMDNEQEVYCAKHEGLRIYHRELLTH